MTAPPKIPFKRAARLHNEALKQQDLIAKRRAEREAKRKLDAERALNEARAADRKARAALARMNERKKAFAMRRARELQRPVEDKFPKIRNSTGVGGAAPFIARDESSPPKRAASPDVCTHACHGDGCV